MNSWFRHHLYAVKVASRRLWLTPFSSLTNILVIAFVLALPIIAASILVSVAPLTKDISINPAITLYMSETTSLADTEALAQQIKHDHNNLVQKVEVVNKTDALKSLQETPSWADALKVLPKNPLPHAIILTIDNPDAYVGSSEKATELANTLSQLSAVDTVQFDSAWVNKLQAITYLIKIILALLAFGVAVVVIATIFNTVRMQALVQRDEIAVARLVGATESFVRRPFLYLGALTGFIAGLLSIVLSNVALYLMALALDDISQSYGQTLTIQLPETYWLAFAIILTMVIASLAALWSVTRHSKF